MRSRVISTLGEAGLLQRTSDDGDRRAAWVQATPAGETLARRMQRERTEAVTAALGGLAVEDQRLIESALPALERLAEQLREQDR